MTDTIQTYIIPNSAKVTQYLAQPEIPLSLQGMFTTGLSATGFEPATHWISSGYLSAEEQLLIANYGIEPYYDPATDSYPQGLDAISAAGLQIVNTVEV